MKYVIKVAPETIDAVEKTDDGFRKFAEWLLTWTQTKEFLEILSLEQRCLKSTRSSAEWKLLKCRRYRHELYMLVNCARNRLDFWWNAYR